MTDAPFTAESAPKPAKLSPTVAAVLRWGRLCVIASFGAIALAEITGVRWPFNLITPYTPQWALVALLGVALLVALRWRGIRTWRQDRVFLVIGIFIAIYAGAITFGLIPWRIATPAKVASSNDPHLATLRVLSANVHSTNQNYDAVLRLIRDEQPDVILLMELNTPWIEATRELNAIYPHRRVMPDETGNFGIGIWTKLDVEDARLVLMTEGGAESSGNGSRYNRLDVPQADMTMLVPDRMTGERHRVRFVGLHPLPPMNRLMSRARDAVLVRAAKSVAEQPALPTVVAGDLNATRYCRMLRDITGRAKLSDAASPIRFSWPNTWSWWAMGIRIDHVLVSDDHWRVVAVKPGPDIGSDHMPIVATLQLVKAPAAMPATVPSN